MKVKRWQWTLAALVLLAVAGAAWFLWRSQLWRAFTNRQTLQEWIVSLGPWGPAVIVIGEILQVMLAPVPGQVVGIVAGYLYGTWWGTALAMTGLMLGTMLAAWLARLFGRPLVERVAGRELLDRVDGYVEHRGSLALLLIFLIPFLPDDLVCFVAGLTPLGLGRIFLLALIGRLPGVVASTLIGSQARNLSWVEIGLLAGVSIVLVIVVALFQKRLEQAMFALLERFTGKS